jgi:hypothetical protein
VGQRQLNIRLPDEDLAVLDAQAYLKRAALSDLVRSLLLAEIARMRKMPRVQAALRLRAEEDAEETGVLTSLEGRHRRTGGDGK